MVTKVNPIPEGYHTVTPVLTVHGAAKMIDFLKQAFDAKETYRLDGPNGDVMHAEVKIGDSMIMVGETTDQWKPMQATVALYVQDTGRIHMGGTGGRYGRVRHPSENRAISSMETAALASRISPGTIGGFTRVSKLCRRKKSRNVQSYG